MPDTVTFPADLLQAQADYLAADRDLAAACRPLPTLAADYPPGAAEETARLREAMRTAATAVNGHPFWSTVERERLVDARSALKQAARRTLGLPDPQ